MSFEIPSQQPPRKKGGGGLFFMIILGVGAYLLFSNLGKGPKPGGDLIEGQGSAGSAGAQAESAYDRQVAEDKRQYEAERDSILGGDETNKGKKMPTTGRTGAAKGWEMDDDVATQRKPSDKSGKAKDGWEMEDVDTKKNKDDGQFKFSGQAETPAKKANNDWSIDDVNKPKKTTNGDWSIEDQPNKKKD